MDFDKLPSHEVVQKTIEAIQARGIQAEAVRSREQALARLKDLIPDGAVVMTGGSLTLTQIGLDDVLISGKHPWRNFKNALLAEKDPVKQMALRLQSTQVEYYLGGINAITEPGELVWGSATGSQLPAYSFTSKNVIWVAGAQKITPDLESALKRIREYVLPLEDKRQKSLGNKNGSFIGQILIFEREPAFLHRNLRVILVEEILGL
jgi:hypothetical protein